MDLAAEPGRAVVDGYKIFSTAGWFASGGGEPRGEEGGIAGDREEGGLAQILVVEENTSVVESDIRSQHPTPMGTRARQPSSLRPLRR
jgi:hypothetical protein